MNRDLPSVSVVILTYNSARTLNKCLSSRESLLKPTYRLYLFDIDIVHQLVENGSRKFAKVEIGIA